VDWARVVDAEVAILALAGHIFRHETILELMLGLDEDVVGLDEHTEVVVYDVESVVEEHGFLLSLQSPQGGVASAATASTVNKRSFMVRSGVQEEVGNLAEVAEHLAAIIP
jgi:hypothetical protein